MMTSWGRLRHPGAGLGIHAWKRFRARAVDTGTDILFAAGTEAKSILGSHGVASRMKVSIALARWQAARR
jgi:hypothetical protein